MSTQTEDILKNAKIAGYKELLFDDDLENLSFSVDDSSDSFNLNTSSPNCSQPTSSEQEQGSGYGPIKDTIKSAKDFLESEAFATITKDKVTISGGREKLNILCTTSKHLYESAMRGVVQARQSSSVRQIGVGPAVHVCIAWLCHAAQCQISDVVPGGEVFPNAERYIRERLRQELLPEIPKKDRIELAVFQICRVLDLLSVCDLRSQSPVDRSILVYAICRVLLDTNSCCAMQYRASLAIENILNASSVTQRATVVEFSNIFPLISDDIRNLKLCHEIIRESNVVPSTCLSLFSSTLIHLSERAECEPSDVERLSEVDFIDAHIGVILDVFDDVMDLCENDNTKRCMIITMLDASLHPSISGMMSDQRKQQINELFLRLKRVLGASSCPDEALVYRLLRNLMDRFEIQLTSESTSNAMI